MCYCLIKKQNDSFVGFTKTFTCYNVCMHFEMNIIYVHQGINNFFDHIFESCRRNIIVKFSMNIFIFQWDIRIYKQTYLTELEQN